MTEKYRTVATWTLTLTSAEHSVACSWEIRLVHCIMQTPNILNATKSWLIYRILSRKWSTNFRSSAKVQTVILTSLWVIFISWRSKVFASADYFILSHQTLTREGRDPLNTSYSVDVNDVKRHTIWMDHCCSWLSWLTLYRHPPNMTLTWILSLYQTLLRCILWG